MITTPTSRQAFSPATLAGLALALLGPMLAVFLGSAIFATEQSEARVGFGLAVHWLNLLAVLAIVLMWERQPLASIGVQRFRWWTIPLGLAAGVVILVVASVLITALKLSSDEHYAVFLKSLPFITRLAVVITAGVFEETLYRGYALERLTTLCRSKWPAAVITLAAFTLAHVPAVGLAHLAPVFLVSLFVTLLYLWKRNLVVAIVAHVTIDAIGLLL